MEIPQIPDDEVARTNELEVLGVVYSPAEARFDRLTRLAQRHFGVSSALVSLVYQDMQWFKSSQGLNACSTLREVSFCGHVVHSKELMVVENTLSDPRFQDNPLVTEEPKIRFYAGVPVKGPKGNVLGTLCLLNSSPRTFSTLDIHDLKDFGALVEGELGRSVFSPVVNSLIAELTEHQRSLLIDPVVGSWNRIGIAKVLDRELGAATLFGQYTGLLHIGINDFEAILQRFGKARAIDFCKFVAGKLRQCAKSTASLGTVSEGAFLLICPDTTEDYMMKLDSDIKEVFLSDQLQTMGVTAMVDVITRFELINCTGLSQESRQRVVTLISEI